MHLEFKNSATLSIGLELELQLINLNNLNLSQDAGELLRRLENIQLNGAVKPEITQGMIELNSTIHSHPDTLIAELKNIRKIINKEAQKIDLSISGGGSHPFQKWSDQKIFPTERFENLLQTYGYLTKLFTVFGQHIHVGCDSGNRAVDLCHALARFMPHFITLSASSPFYQQMDSEFDSSRLNVICAFPTAGSMPKLKNWNEFEQYFYKLVDLKMIGSIKDLYWDIRPKAEFGTVEIRICDTPLEIDKAVQLTAYAQALSSYLFENPPITSLDDLYLVYNYNKFQAAKFGFDGTIIDPVNKNKIKIQDDILKTIKLIQPHIQKLNLDDYIQPIHKQTSEKVNDSKILRDLYQQLKTFPDLVRKQTEIWSNS